MTSINKKILFLLFLITFSLNSFSQDFDWTASIKNSNETGFVNIWLAPEINAKLTNDFRDIRIYNTNNKEIPYIQQSEKIQNRKIFFKEYKILEKKHISSKHYTRLIIHNPEKKIIDNISVIVKNADVKKWLKLNGSDDNKTFYVLNDNYVYNSQPNTDGTSEIRVLHFPNTDYEFLELLVSDYFDRPINILKVGYYDTEIENGVYSELNISGTKQTENTKEKESSVIFSFGESQYIDKLEFKFDGPTYYLRNAELFVETEVENRKTKEKHNDWQYVSDFELNSFSNANLNFDKLFAQKLKLVIKNDDNEALKIKSIKARQLSKYLIAELKKDENYTLKFGDTEIHKAKYDLQYFADSIDKNLPILKVENIQKIAKEEVKPTESIFNSYYIWIALGFVVLGLGYMSIKMMKEMK